MPPLDPRRPTDAELPILAVLWARGPSTVRQVHDVLNETRRTGYTTVLKLMQIMMDKGLLERDESVRPQVYRPLRTRGQTQRHLTSDLLERAFGGAPGPLVLQALSSRKTTAEEREQIRQLLDKLERDFVMNVLDAISGLPVAEAVGWTLVHFLWEGAVIGALVGVVLWCLRGRSASARYLACGAGMLAMAFAPVVTILVAWPTVGEPGGAIALPTAVAPSAAWERLRPLLPAMTMAWLLGVVVLQTRLVLQWSHARHLRHDGTRPVPASWSETVAELGATMGLPASVRCLESSIARVPMMIGWLRPAVLLPAAAFTGLTPHQLRTIIAHELAHVRRHDYLVNLIQAVLETLLFYHPAVWWLSGRMRAEREYCCDDMAVRVCGDALAYAQALAALEDMRCHEGHAVLASTGGSLMQRIRRIAGIPSPRPRRAEGWLAPLVVAASVTIAVTALAVDVVAPGEGTAPDAYDPMDDVNIVAILREFEFEDAETIELLRESGLDNRSLVAVVEELGAEERILASIDRMARRMGFVEEHMSGARKEVASALASGRLTVEDAQERLAGARRELHREHRARERRHRERDEQAAMRRPELEELVRHVEEEVAAGRLTTQEAARVVEDARAKVEVHRALAAAGKRMDTVRAEVHRELELGRISEEEAHAHLARAEEEIGAKRRQLDRERNPQFGPVERELHDRMQVVEAKLEAIHAQLAEAVAAGALTEAEAKQRIEHHHQELVQLREMAHQRHRATEGERKASAESREPQSEDVALRRAVEERLHAVRERLGAEVEAGRLTDEEAKQRLHDVEAELEARAAKIRDEPRRRPRAEGDPVELRRLRESDVRERDAARARRREPPRRAELSRADLDALRAHVRSARSDLERAVAEGRVTADEAAKRLERLGRVEASLAERAKRTTTKTPRAPREEPAAAPPAPRER